jgi:hypothetical protein
MGASQSCPKCPEKTECPKCPEQTECPTMLELIDKDYKQWKCVKEKIQPLIKDELGLDMDIDQSVVNPYSAEGDVKSGETRIEQVMNLDVYSQLSDDSKSEINKCLELEENKEQFLSFRGNNTVLLFVILLFLIMYRKKLMKILGFI